MSMKCSYCGRETGTNKKCPYCGKAAVRQTLTHGNGSSQLSGSQRTRFGWDDKTRTSFSEKFPEGRTAVPDPARNKYGNYELRNANEILRRLKNIEMLSVMIVVLLGGIFIAEILQVLAVL